MGRRISYEEVKALRAKGMTYREIGNVVGCSYQRVSQICAIVDETCLVKTRQCVFSGLRNWMNENNVSRTDLYRMMYGGKSMDKSSACTMSNRMKGKTPWKLHEINLIIDITGLSYEQLFREGVKQSEEEKQSTVVS